MGFSGKSRRRHPPLKSGPLLAAIVALITAGTAVGLDIDPYRNNRPPNAPTPVSPANNAEVMLRNPKADVQLTWRDNGDPDGDDVSFVVDVRYFDPVEGTWKQAYRQPLAETSSTFSLSNTGTPGNYAYLAWRVFAVDSSNRSEPAFSAGEWSVFKAVFTSTGRMGKRKCMVITTNRRTIDVENEWPHASHPEYLANPMITSANARCARNSKTMIAVFVDGEGWCAYENEEILDIKLTDCP